MYGPSGCGKSSLVKAGLLPRLANHVTVVYVEATPDDTEARLRRGLHSRCPGLDEGLGLVESLATLRDGRGLAPGQKVLLVLDQFEQWLHARGAGPGEELVQALRQCDGSRVQALVMVRDDFWMAVTRFMRELEIRLVDGQNSAAVDLFDADHAGKVLATFGRAFGRWPENVTEVTKEQQAFLSQAVAALATDGKVICVQLALFAEMMKGRPWTLASLREMGGIEGIGAIFLEETFSARGAPPERRYHQKAARLVLKALLPETGSDIKGTMRSRLALQEMSGYGARPKEFGELLDILDGEVRLITPSDPETSEPGALATGKDEPVANAQSTENGRFYQLTHDYLVPSLHEWLTHKQKETRRGRAELLLADRAALWNVKPENRQLPSLPQWVGIRLLTRRKDWTPPQRKMMRRAGRYHGVRGLAVAATLLLFLGTGWEVHGRLRAQALMDNLLRAPTEDVPAVVRDMGSYHRWLDGPLHQAYADAEANGDARKQLHASLALLPVDDGQVEYLYGRLLAAEPQEVIALREALRPHGETLGERLWAVLEDAKGDPGQRLRAACTLAVYALDDGRWEQVSGDVAGLLVAENALVVGQWARALKPVGRHLLAPLALLLLQEKSGAAERRTITGIYASYAGEAPNAFAPLEAVLAEESGPKATADERLALNQRQANAAAALAALGRWGTVAPLLRHKPDPTLRSYLIDRLGSGGVEVRAMSDRFSLERKADVSAARALLLALGGIEQDRLPPAEREALVKKLLDLYREDEDAGIHGASFCLLGLLGQQAQVEGIDQQLVKDREKRLEQIRQECARGQADCGPRWYVNCERQTFAIVPPGEYEWEQRGKWKVRVERRFALAAREVTVGEFSRFHKDYQSDKRFAPTEDCPAILVKWYAAAAYCNWLSEKEGIAEDQRCYVRNEKGEYAEGMKVKANAQSLSGYRLPTEPEWEMACRAGSVMPWSMGEAEDLLGKYAWHVANSATRSPSVGALATERPGAFRYARQRRGMVRYRT